MPITPIVAVPLSIRAWSFSPCAGHSILIWVPVSDSAFAARYRPAGVSDLIMLLKPVDEARDADCGRSRWRIAGQLAEQVGGGLGRGNVALLHRQIILDRRLAERGLEGADIVHQRSWLA